MNEIMNFMKKQQLDTAKKYAILNRCAKKGETLFTGSSLMEHFPVNELLMTYAIDKVIYNRGIGGFTTSDFLAHMDEMVFGTSPSKIFINIGTNDIGSPDYKLEHLMENYQKILTQIAAKLPACRVYLLAYYPVNETVDVPGADPNDPWVKNRFRTRTNVSIAAANEALERLAHTFDYTFLNVNEGLTDASGRLKAELTIEGIHMYPNAYDIILHNLLPYL